VITIAALAGLRLSVALRVRRANLPQLKATGPADG
jgi:hypothetical protein